MTASISDGSKINGPDIGAASAVELWRQSLDPKRGPAEVLTAGTTRLPALIEDGRVMVLCPRTGCVVDTYNLPDGSA